MTANQIGDGMCHETSGFLFSHQCDRFATQACSTCQKPLCEDHGHLVPEGIMCTTCLKRKNQAERQPDDDPHRRSDYSDHESHSYGNDPYFYGNRYYPGYRGHAHHSHASTGSSSAVPGQEPFRPDTETDSGGDFSSGDSGHDPDDFTEGDADSVRNEGDASFETDMGGS